MHTKTEQTTDWITPHDSDPRMPTDPEYVAVGALTERYRASREALMRFAIQYPRCARTSGGNPWTENHGEETLFLHEPSVSEHFRKL